MPTSDPIQFFNVPISSSFKFIDTFLLKDSRELDDRLLTTAVGKEQEREWLLVSILAGPLSEEETYRKGKRVLSAFVG